MGIEIFQSARIASQIASKKMYGVALASGLAVIVSGCAGEGGSEAITENVGQAIQPIIRGITSGTERDSVVVLGTFVNGQRRSLCTATLVAPNLVLTARHCVSDTDPSTACSMDGTPVAGAALRGDRAASSLAIFVGHDGVAPNSATDAKADAHGAKLIVDNATTVCNRDVAFIVIDKKLEGSPVAPIRLGAPKMDEKLSAVGWGIDQTGVLPAERQERSDIPLIGVGPGLYPNNQAWGYGNAEFMIGESACSGDSGGPAFAKSGAVVGVAARAGNGKAKDPNNMASTCVGDSAHAVYTHLGFAPELVARAFKESGEEIWLEGQPDPRAPKPANVPAAGATGAPGVGQEKTTKSAEGEAIPLPSDPKPEGEAGGCSISSSSPAEAQNGSVEYAAGLVALLASLIGLRRRFGKRQEEEVTPSPSRKPLPSIP